MCHRILTLFTEHISIRSSKWFLREAFWVSGKKNEAISSERVHFLNLHCHFKNDTRGNPWTCSKTTCRLSPPVNACGQKRFKRNCELGLCVHRLWSHCLKNGSYMQLWSKVQLICPGQVAPLVGASSRTPKGCAFKFWSGGTHLDCGFDPWSVGIRKHKCL